MSTCVGEHDTLCAPQLCIGMAVCAVQPSSEHNKQERQLENELSCITVYYTAPQDAAECSIELNGPSQSSAD